MQAQQLLNRNASRFGGPTARIMQQAFEEAWAMIAHRWANDQKATADNRLKLAECIVAVTPDGTTDIDQLKRMALDMFQVISRP
jgi:hypothetical protein